MSEESADLVKLADEVTRFPARFMESVYIGDAPGSSFSADCATGTATLLRLGDNYYAVTCSHVISEVFRRHSAGKATHFQIGNLSLDPFKQIIDQSQELDLAVIEIVPSQVSDEDCPEVHLSSGSFFSPRYWPPDPVTTEDVVSFAGFPGEWREQHGIAEICNFIFCHGATNVHSVGANYLWTRIELEKCQGWTLDDKKIGEIGGMSGGPVFSWRQGKLQADLVGFIQEYNKELDLLYVRSSRVLRSDGRLVR